MIRDDRNQENKMSSDMMARIDLLFLGTGALGFISDANVVLQFLTLLIAAILGLYRLKNTDWNFKRKKREDQKLDDQSGQDVKGNFK